MSAELSKTFETRFRSTAPDLSRVTEEAVCFLEANGIRGKAVYAAHLAMEEMGTNILKYGYDDTTAHEIPLHIEILPGQILIVLEDDGHEFNPLNIPEPDVNLPAGQRQPGGLGIYLVRKFAEAMRYERRDGRNRLTITIQT